MLFLLLMLFLFKFSNGVSSIKIFPEFFFKKPNNSLNKVLLPTPFFPSKQTKSPSFISKVIFSKIILSEYPKVKFFTFKLILFFDSLIIRYKKNGAPIKLVNIPIGISLVNRLRLIVSTSIRKEEPIKMEIGRDIL